jgi:hypothetical protein
MANKLKPGDDLGAEGLEQGLVVLPGQAMALEMAIAEASEKPSAPPLTRKVWRIWSKRESYHSAQRHWTPEPVDVPVGELTPEQEFELGRDPFMVIQGPFEVVA